MFVIPSLVRGGAEGQLCELIRRIDRDAFEPTLVLFDHVADGYPYDTLHCGVRVLKVPSGGNRHWLKKGARHIATVARLYRCLRELSPDIVHASLPAATILGGLTARLARVPVTISARRSLFFYRDHVLSLGLADRYTLRFADAVTANCAAIAKLTVEKDGYPKDRIYLIQNGVDCDRFRPGGDPRLRQRFRWSSEHVVFGMIANFYSFKRHVDFLYAAAQIHRAFPQSRFLLVGRAETSFEDVMRLREELDLEQVVEILPGTDTPESVYAALDVYVSTSATEGMPNVVLEAMACGLPVIATDVGGSAEVVTDGRTGYLVPPFAPSAVADAGCALAGDGVLRRRFGAQAALIARRRFTMEGMVEAHEKLYQALARQVSCAIARSALSTS